MWRTVIPSRTSPSIGGTPYLTLVRTSKDPCIKQTTASSRNNEDAARLSCSALHGTPRAGSGLRDTTMSKVPYRPLTKEPVQGILNGLSCQREARIFRVGPLLGIDPFISVGPWANIKACWYEDPALLTCHDHTSTKVPCREKDHVFIGELSGVLFQLC